MSRRHNVKKIKLSRNYNQRKALIKGLLISLINSGQVNTTLKKAKVLKSRFDKLAAKAQTNTVHIRRQISSSLSNHKAANKLIDKIAPLMPHRRGGFTSIEKIGIRRGDASVMATVKLSIPLSEAKDNQSKKSTSNNNSGKTKNLFKSKTIKSVKKNKK